MWAILLGFSLFGWLATVHSWLSLVQECMCADDFAPRSGNMYDASQYFKNPNSIYSRQQHCVSLRLRDFPFPQATEAIGKNFYIGPDFPGSHQIDRPSLGACRGLHRTTPGCATNTSGWCPVGFHCGAAGTCCVQGVGIAAVEMNVAPSLASNHLDSKWEDTLSLGI